MSGPSAIDHAPLPYREMTDLDYARRAAEDFVLDIDMPGSPVLCGHCPRCHGYMTFLVVDDLYKNAQRHADNQQKQSHSLDEPAESQPSRVETAGESDVVPMICTCEGLEHSGRPGDAEGCGAYWLFRIQLEAQ